MPISLTALLHRASQAVDAQFAKELAEGVNVTVRQVAVLAAVAQREGCSQTDIVDETGIDRSTLADICRRLVERGLLARKRSKVDARAYMLTITPPGRELVSLASRAQKRAEAAVLNALPARKRDESEALLAELVDRKLSDST